MGHWVGLLTTLLLIPTCLLAEAGQTSRSPLSPVRSGDTLYIEGRIGSHIYDYLAFEGKKLSSLKKVTLNSWGGDHNWALEIARKLRELKLTTALESGHVCASACVYLFASGHERQMAEDTWLGIHGARLGAGYILQYQQICQQNQESAACKEYLDQWFQVSYEATKKAFLSMESSGVSSDLFLTYFNFPDDSNWTEAMNVLKKPDWMVTPEVALQFALATELTPATEQHNLHYRAL